MCVASDTIWYSEVGISFAAGTREHLPEPRLRIQDSTIRFDMSIARKLSAVTVSTNSGPMSGAPRFVDGLLGKLGTKERRI